MGLELTSDFFRDKVFVTSLAANGPAALPIDEGQIGSIVTRGFDPPDVGEQCVKSVSPSADEVSGMKIGREGKEELVVFAIAESLLDSGASRLLGMPQGVVAVRKNRCVDYCLEVRREELRKILGESVGEIDHGMDAIKLC